MNSEEQVNLLEQLSLVITRQIDDSFDKKVKALSEENFRGFISVLEKTDDKISLIAEGLLDVRDKISALETKVDALDVKTSALDIKFNYLDQKVSTIDQKLDKNIDETIFIKEFLINNLEPRIVALEDKDYISSL